MGERLARSHIGIDRFWPGLDGIREALDQDQGRRSPPLQSPMRPSSREGVGCQRIRILPVRWCPKWLHDIHSPPMPKEDFRPDMLEMMNRVAMAKRTTAGFPRSAVLWVSGRDVLHPGCHEFGRFHSASAGTGHQLRILPWDCPPGSQRRCSCREAIVPPFARRQGASCSFSAASGIRQASPGPWEPSRLGGGA